MKLSVYTTAFNVIDKKFDYADAFDNFFYYAHEVSVAVNTSHDDTLAKITEYAARTRRNLIITPTTFDYDDPFCYGKIVNAALQATSGDILILQDLDERLGGDKQFFYHFAQFLLDEPTVQSFFLPVIDLYGSYDNYLTINGKWYMHKKGLFRGPVSFGIKPDGRPDYNKTSTDELIDAQHNLVPTVRAIDMVNMMCKQYPQDTDNTHTPLSYMQAKYPFVYHLGYVDYNERLNRNVFWKEFWEKATGGDKNSHATTPEELIAKENMIRPHRLPMWFKLT